VGRRLGFLMPRSFKPVAGASVAAALLAAAREGRPGTRILESATLQDAGIARRE
jgi:hypothetical protein